VDVETAKETGRTEFDNMVAYLKDNAATCRTVLWDGNIYPGKHEPLVTRELWDRVQRTMDERHRKRHRKGKHNFAFSRLITCGHCGCSCR